MLRDDSVRYVKNGVLRRAEPRLQPGHGLLWPEAVQQSGGDLLRRAADQQDAVRLL